MFSRMFLCSFCAFALLCCKHDVHNQSNNSTNEQESSDLSTSISEAEAKQIEEETAFEVEVEVEGEVEDEGGVRDAAVADADLVSDGVATKKPQAKKPKKKKKKYYPKIEFEQMVFEFDTITEGDTIGHNFKFTNTGKAPLNIKSANASCGCAQPSFPFLAIEPGQSDEIRVKFISIGKEGYQSPEITVKSDGSRYPIVLKMEGFVRARPKVEESEKDSLGNK